MTVRPHGPPHRRSFPLLRGIFVSSFGSCFGSADTCASTQTLDAATPGRQHVKSLPPAALKAVHPIFTPSTTQSTTITTSTGASLVPLEGQHVHFQNNNSDAFVKCSILLAATHSIHAIAVEDPTAHIRCLEPVGQGSHGMVYRGQWQGMSICVRFMLQREGNIVVLPDSAVGRVPTHPNVVAVYSWAGTVLQFDGIGSRGIPLSRHSTARSPRLSRVLSEKELACELLEFGSSSVSIDTPSAAGGSDVRWPFSSLIMCSTSSVDPSAAGDDGSKSHGTSVETAAATCRSADGMQLCDILTKLQAHSGDSLIHVVMQHCDGGSLSDLIQSGVFQASGALPVRPPACNDPSVLSSYEYVLLRTLRDVAQGLAHLHAAGVCHGQLRPSNVLLAKSRHDRRGFVAKVSDWGLSHDMTSLKGDWRSCAPELSMASSVHASPPMLQASAAADVWAYGALIWAMCTGVEASTSGSPGTKPACWPPGHQDWPAHIPRAVRKLGCLCLQDDPAARPSCNEIASSLARLERRMTHSSRASSAAGDCEAAHEGTYMSAQHAASASA